MSPSRLHGLSFSPPTPPSSSRSSLVLLSFFSSHSPLLPQQQHPFSPAHELSSSLRLVVPGHDSLPVSRKDNQLQEWK